MADVRRRSEAVAALVEQMEYLVKGHL